MNPTKSSVGASERNCMRPSRDAADKNLHEKCATAPLTTGCDMPPVRDGLESPSRSSFELDVADELGLMIIGETAIRGSNGDQDFVGGHDNMVGHARARAP